MGKTTPAVSLFNMYDLTAAHSTLPLETRVRVTNMHNGKAVRSAISVRAPIVRNRIIDLPYGAARLLGFERNGIQRVRLDR
jgi:rare lipoprotein A